MSWKDICHNKWIKFIFWAFLYVLWVIWLGSYWWLLGLVVVFDLLVTKKVNWLFWQKKYKEGEKHNELLDWLDAVIFAVVVVTFINIFFFQAFKIPSSSMESSLYTGDHLFVSKLAYGPRVPQTPLTIPFTHNTIGRRESYSTLITNDYRRLKGFREVKRGDIVVFGFPNGDTVLTQAPAEDYYSLSRVLGRQNVIDRLGPVKVRPSDKKDHYVKRCVAVAGDTLEVRDGIVYVNGEKETVQPGMQLSYRVVTNGQKINSKVIEKLGISAEGLYFDSTMPGYPNMFLTGSMLEQVRACGNVITAEPNLETVPSVYNSFNEVFPFKDTEWTRDYYGKIWIPKKGVTVPLSQENLPLYERIIRDYEHNTLEVRDGGTVMINGEKADSYTFRQDYYFMMGDNRHNSLDSRYWGFVPEDHIVGKPSVVWLSTNGKAKFPNSIRWSRFFKFV